MATVFGAVEDLRHVSDYCLHASQDKKDVSYAGHKQGGGGEGDEEGGQQELEKNQQDVAGGRCQSCRRAGKVERHLNAEGVQKCRNAEHQKNQQKPSGEG